MLPSDDVEKLAEIIYRHSQKTCTAKAEEYIVDLAGLEFTHFLAINDHNNQNCQKRGVNDGADVCNQQNLCGGARAKDEGGSSVAPICALTSREDADAANRQMPSRYGAAAPTMVLKSIVRSLTSETVIPCG